MSQNPFVSISRCSEIERPRERLFLVGASGLSEAELVSILIGHGTTGRSALDIARTVLTSCSELSTTSLLSVNGIGKAKAARILAGIELGRRQLVQKNSAVARLLNSRAVYELMSMRLVGQSIEMFYVIGVDVKNRPKVITEVARGTAEGVSFQPREVLNEVIRSGSSGMILVHNHPSGDSTPSFEDTSLTKRMKEGACVVGIRFVDHVIIANREYYSFVEQSKTTI